MTWIEACDTSSIASKTTILGEYWPLGISYHRRILYIRLTPERPHPIREASHMPGRCQSHADGLTASYGLWSSDQHYWRTFPTTWQHHIFQECAIKNFFCLWQNHTALSDYRSIFPILHQNASATWKSNPKQTLKAWRRKMHRWPRRRSSYRLALILATL